MLLIESTYRALIAAALVCIGSQAIADIAVMNEQAHLRMHEALCGVAGAGAGVVCIYTD